jgi:hypothetical protein
MAGEVGRRDRTTGQRDRGGDLDAVFEVRIADGVDGQRLAAQQARVIYEVMTWWARNRPSPGNSQTG